MALSIVSATTTKIVGASGTSWSGSLNATPTAGNMLVVGVTSTGTAANYTVSDNHGNTYTLVASAGVSSSTVASAALFYAKNIATGSPFTITANNHTGNTGGEFVVYEVAGADTTAPFTAGEASSNNGSGTAATTPAVTNSNANSIYVAFFSSDSGANPATVTAGTGWSMDTTNGRETNGSANWVCGLEYQIVSTSASRGSAMTLSSANWFGGMAIFKAAAGGGASWTGTVGATMTPAAVVARAGGFSRLFALPGSDTGQLLGGILPGAVNLLSPTLTRQVSFPRSAAATQTPAVASTRQTGAARTTGATQTPAASTRRTGVFSRVLAVALTPVATTSRIGAFVRSLAVTEALSAAVTGVLNGGSTSWNRTLSVVGTLTAAITRSQASGRTSGATSSPSPALTRSTSMGRAMGVIQGPQAGLSRLVGSSRSFVLVQTPTALLSGSRGLVRAVSATLSPLIVVSSSRVIGRVISVTVSPVIAVGRVLVLGRVVGAILAPLATASSSATIAALLSAIRRHFVVPPRLFHFLVPPRSLHFIVSDTPYALPATPGSTDNTIGSTENNISYDVDFGPWLLSGEGINSCSVTCSAVLRNNPTLDMTANAAAFVISSAISGTKVVGVVDPHNALIGARYALLFSATTSLGRTLTKPMPNIDCDR